MEISFLKPGSKIVIAAPARCVLREEMAIAIEWLKEQGFVPVYDDALFAQHHIFAGSDDFRAAVFQHYLDSEEIEAIWCARGGYGSIRIVDRLDFSKFLEHPKWLVGFSDITVFHGKLNRLGVPTLHASMPFYFANKTPEAKQSLYDALTGKPLQYTFSSHHLNRCGEAEAEVVGGNLSVLIGMMGSETFPETDGKILFIEEVDEYIYHIDRMMHCLKRAGKLDRLKGLIVGGLTQIKDNTHPFGMTAEQVIAEAVSEYDYPVCFGFPAGHFDDNRALFFGQKSIIKVDSKTSVFLGNLVH
ncbi:MAG: LD-carboxypeptidase [Bacteroidales bacterium]|jgi:muramoyltetrapeptide carboxypeptidase|nr:LD-carboxypeptidase [Bacteroidales bacterium]MBR5631697.1 LD-carboxypeptidase [Bacteroidales bacterium]MBR5912688.1 LD-carboxypeptidase [Bacteroidales bacterium]